MDLCQQSNISAFQHTVYVMAFPAKKQSPSDFRAAVTTCSDFRAQEEPICHYFHLSPSICHEVMGLDAMVLVFLILSFKSALSLSFTLIKRLFSSSLLSAMRVVSLEYLRLLMFLLPILIPAYISFTPAFLMMCSAFKLNKQGINKGQKWYGPNRSKD